MTAALGPSVVCIFLERRHPRRLQVRQVHRDPCLRGGFREQVRGLGGWRLRSAVWEKVVSLG